MENGEWRMDNDLELKSYLNLNLNLFKGLLRLIASEVYGRMRPTHELGTLNILEVSSEQARAEL
jgi:hypothetical protein